MQVPACSKKKFGHKFSGKVGQILMSIPKNAAKRDNAGAVCNSGMGMLFFMYSICLHYFFKGVGGG